MAYRWRNLSDMLNSRAWYGYIGDKLGNDLFINDPERADRIHEYAEYGADGSTHDENLQDMDDFLDLMKVRSRDDWGMLNYDLSKTRYNMLKRQIEDSREWWLKNKPKEFYEPIG